MTIMTLTRERIYFLWGVIGPLLALLTLLVMLLHATPLNLLFAMIIVGGLPCCWYLKQWTPLVAAGLFTGLLFFSPHALTHDLYWNIGLAFSMVLTLGITSFSFDEAMQAIENIQGSNSAQPLQENHELIPITAKHQTEIQVLQKNIESLTLELSQAKDISANLLSNLETAQINEQTARQQVEELQHTLAGVRYELEAKSINDQHVFEELLEKRKEVLELRDQMLELSEDLQQQKEMTEEAKHEVDVIRHTLDGKSLNDEHVLEELLEKRKEVLELKDEILELTENLQHQKALTEDIKAEAETIRHTLDSKTLKDEQIFEEVLEKRKKVLDLQNEVDKLQEALHNRPDEATIETLKAQHQQEKTLALHQWETTANELKAAQEKISILEVIAEKAKAEVQVSRHESNRLKMDFERLKNEWAATRLLDEKIQQELSEEKKINHQLKVNQELLQTKQVEQERDLQNLQVLINKKDQELFNLQFRLDSALEDIQKQELVVANLQEQDLSLKTSQAQLNHQLEELLREKEHLELTHHKLQREVEWLEGIKHEKQNLEECLKNTSKELESVKVALEEAKTTLAKQTHEPVKNEEYGLRRRAEGMYLQLREQFNEKSSVLDDTRRELFKTQEALLELQKSLKETEEYGPRPTEQKLLKHLMKMQKQQDEQIHQYKEEIEQLYDLISHLSGQG